MVYLLIQVGSPREAGEWNCLINTSRGLLLEDVQCAQADIRDYCVMHKILPKTFIRAHIHFKNFNFNHWLWHCQHFTCNVAQVTTDRGALTYRAMKHQTSVASSAQCRLIPSTLLNKHDSCTLHRQHTHTHPFNGPFSGTTRVSRFPRKVKPIWVLLKWVAVVSAGPYASLHCAPDR